MSKTTVVEEKSKRAFLIGVWEEKTSSAELDSLKAEFSSLVDTLGLEIVSQELIHVREKNAKFGIGTGKAGELAQKAVSLEADCVIFDRDLTPSQQRNWEELAGMPVIDRQELIIQIFASRAHTREAELQVNLAKLVYSLPRLQHKYIDLSRQRGGRYGTRGAGETRLETDRRQVEQRIHRLKDELETVKRQRQVQRRQRERSGVPVCALVGYTNTGKSTILNALTNAGVLAEDKLFATLDSTSRRLELSAGVIVLLVDTVGFIRRLPHNLIDAFRSTMEEASHADVLINVLDASSPDIDTQFKTTLSVLQEIGAEGIPMITVLNKIDRLESGDDLEALIKRYPESIPLSALNGTGFDELRARIISATKKVTSKPKPGWSNEQQETENGGN
ncbi:MAG: GTPase HflX [Treponema sp.]|jgi:GTP-binding protein HflX|nr:GTPase HflX [Treponema sp.]